MKKAELMEDLPIEVLNVLTYSQENLFRGGFFSLKFQF